MSHEVIEMRMRTIPGHATAMQSLSQWRFLPPISKTVPPRLSFVFLLLHITLIAFPPNHPLYSILSVELLVSKLDASALLFACLLRIRSFAVTFKPSFLHVASHSTPFQQTTVSLYFILTIFVLHFYFIHVFPFYHFGGLSSFSPIFPFHVHQSDSAVRLLLLHPIQLFPCAAPSLLDPCVNCVCVLPKVSLPIIVLPPPDVRVTCISMPARVLISFSCRSLRLHVNCVCVLPKLTHHRLLVS